MLASSTVFSYQTAASRAKAVFPLMRVYCRTSFRWAALFKQSTLIDLDCVFPSSIVHLRKSGAIVKHSRNPHANTSVALITDKAVIVVNHKCHISSLELCTSGAYPSYLQVECRGRVYTLDRPAVHHRAAAFLRFALTKS